MCTNKEAVENAAASMEMEGFQVSEQSKLWCEQLLNHEITFDEYLARALKDLRSVYHADRYDAGQRKGRKCQRQQRKGNK